jgi:hypothetical protein
MMILENETMAVLANLDWLLFQEGMRLDFKAGVVYGEDGSPAYLLADLATIGLTPATAPRVVSVPWDINPDALIGREVTVKLDMSKTDGENVKVAFGIRPHMDHTAEDLARMKEIAEQPICYRTEFGIMVHGPGCPHTP